VRAPLERRPLADGEAGIEQTRREMMRLISEGSGTLEIIQEARRATILVRPHDTTGEIAAVFDYVTGIGTPYRFDPVGKEMLQAASHQSLGRDCDCFVIWAGALLMALGHQVRVVIGAKRRPLVGAPSWSHTWLEVYDLRKKAWVSFDPVLHLRGGRPAAVGEVAPHAVLWRSGAVSGYEGVNDAALAGLDGFSFKKLVKGVAKVGKKLSTGVVGGVLKQVVSVVPGGSAALKAIEVGSKVVGVVKAVKKGGIGKGLAAVAKVAAPALIGGGKLGPGLKTGLDSLNTASKAVKKVTAAVKLPTVRAPAAPRAVATAKVARPAPALKQAAARLVPKASSVVRKALPAVASKAPSVVRKALPALAVGAAAAAAVRKPLDISALSPKLQRLIAAPQQALEAQAQQEEPAEPEEPQTDLLEEETEAASEEEQAEEDEAFDGDDSQAEEDFSEPSDEDPGFIEGEE
jgi:hypothetical protein